MKKIIFLSYFILLFGLSTQLFGADGPKRKSRFSGAFSAGYVFKNDCRFKNVYGRGIVNAITADGCYYPWELWGIGAKVSYWRKKGCTDFLKQRTLLQEVPVTFYVRRKKQFKSGLQLYASLGGGFVWVKEKSYLGNVRLYKGIGEVEAGLKFPIFRCVDITAAFRYLFPPQSRACDKVHIGGFDLRAGIGFSF